MTQSQRTRPGRAPESPVRVPSSRSGTAAGPRPSAEQLTAWRLFLRSHALVLRRLENDLVTEHQLPLASYDVLVQLVEAPDRRLRMTELADAVLLSRSGLTRLVDRLEREGLVERQACVEDARGLFAVLTDAGLLRLREAAPTHLRGIQEYAVGRLSREELRELARLLAVFADTEAPAGPTGTDLREARTGAGATGPDAVVDLTQAAAAPATRAD